MGKMHLNCATCFFFEKHPDARAAGGLCHFAPPTPMIIGMQQVAGLVHNGQPNVQPVVGSQFPPVQPDAWCGCWREGGLGE